MKCVTYPCSFIFAATFVALSSQAQNTPSTAVSDFIFANHQLLENPPEGGTLKFGVPTETANLQSEFDAYLSKHPDLDPNTCHFSNAEPAQETLSDESSKFPAREADFLTRYRTLGNSEAGKFPFGLYTIEQPPGTSKPIPNRTTREADGMDTVKQGLLAFAENAKSKNQHITKIYIDQSILKDNQIDIADVLTFLRSDLGVDESKVQYVENAKNAITYASEDNKVPYTEVKYRYQYVTVSCTTKQPNPTSTPAPDSSPVTTTTPQATSETFIPVPPPEPNGFSLPPPSSASTSTPPHSSGSGYGTGKKDRHIAIRLNNPFRRRHPKTFNTRRNHRRMFRCPDIHKK